MSFPFTALFAGCDSYFASLKQHLDPVLRGRPVAVAPVIAESSCCVAASDEARAFGDKTGTSISDTWIMCLGIAIVESKLPKYIRFHHQIITAVADWIHVEALHSIDEMWTCLPCNSRARYGRMAIYFGNVQDGRDTAPMRISFANIPDLKLEPD